MAKHPALMILLLALSGCAEPANPPPATGSLPTAKSGLVGRAANPLPGKTNRLRFTWAVPDETLWRIAWSSNRLTFMLTNYVVIEGRGLGGMTWQVAGRAPVSAGQLGYESTNRGMLFRARGEWL